MPELRELDERLLRRRCLSAGAVRAVAALCVITALGLALGACTKCDVPVWTAPRACHDTPAQQ
jgi:hypothetical protein